MATDLLFLNSHIREQGKSEAELKKYLMIWNLIQNLIQNTKNWCNLNI